MRPTIVDEAIVDRFDEETEKKRDDDRMVVQSPSQFLLG
jgi:hypothetical protein